MRRKNHLLNAASNVFRLRENIRHLLSAESEQKFELEILKNVKQFLELGKLHRNFAIGLNPTDWRQIVSRLYYGCYAYSRAIRFVVDGAYSEESSDHKKVSNLPDDLPNVQRYINIFPTIRDDRNLADYDHTATEAELVNSVTEVKSITDDFFKDVEKYIRDKGYRI